MAYRKNEKIARHIVNLTNQSFSVYEDSTGKIATFDPTYTPLPPEPRYSKDEIPSIIYVVARDVFEELKRTGGTLDDIAFVNERNAGWHGHEVCRLIWAKDPSVYVRFREH